MKHNIGWIREECGECGGAKVRTVESDVPKKPITFHKAVDELYDRREKKPTDEMEVLL